MPSLNLLHRKPDRPTLRERAAILKAGLARAIHRSAPVTETKPDPADAGIEEFAQLEFGAYEFDDPLKAPREWAARFAEYAMAMHVADRTLRMSKPEMIAFIRDAGSRDAELPEIMFRSLDCARETFDGWGKLLEVARSRYVVAASAEHVEADAQGHGDQDDGSASSPPPQIPTKDSFVAAHQIERASDEGRVLASSAIFHKDGTVSYCDAGGRVSRRPMAHWVAFVATQLHARVASEITRQMNAAGLSGEEMYALESRLRRELRSDAVFALAFHSDRAFKAGEDYRSGAGPATQAEWAKGDADLITLAPRWQAARDLHARLHQEYLLVCDSAEPGPVRNQSHEEWMRQVSDWRARTGVGAAEDAWDDASIELCAIEDQIAELPAASLAGLKLKAQIAQRNDDIDVDWPVKLGAGLTRDILAFAEVQAKTTSAASLPPDTAVADGLGLGTMPVEELAATHDVAMLIKGVAHAVACQPRCEKGGRAGPGSNAAGSLMNWVAEAMTAVEDTALKVMRNRAPTDHWEQNARLRVLAEATVANGDSDQITSFAHELLATVET